MINKALEYAKHVPVFPLIPDTKKPLIKNGFKEATQDIEQIKRWWTNKPDANIGAVTAEKGFIVLDLDTAEDTPEERLPDGAYTLSDLGIWNELKAVENVQFYKTPSGGLHYWFKTDNKLLLEKRRTGKGALWDSVELLGAGGYSIVPPSKTATGAYTGDLDIEKVPDIPEWLESILVKQIENKNEPLFKADYSSNVFKNMRGKTHAGILLDKIVSGADEGSRNEWLTSVTGSLFNTGMEPENVLILLQVINNEFNNPPLNNKELITIFKSILQREAGKNE